MLVFSGIGNVHAVKDAFEELRNALDPWKTESSSKKDRWRDDSSKALTEKYVSDCRLRPLLAHLVLLVV